MQALKLTEYQESIDDSSTHYALLHPEQAGVSILWERAGQNSGKVWHKLQPDSPEIPVLLRAQLGQPDRYVSVNEFYAWRIVKHLKSLRALFVDIDDPSLRLPDLLDSCNDNGFPFPSFVMHTGNGMHAYWLHNPLDRNYLPAWQQCQNIIVAALAADRAAKDCTRVLRLAGTVNSKNNANVHGIILDPRPVPFEDLYARFTASDDADEMLRSVNKVKDFRVAKAKKVLKPGQRTIFSRWYRVYKDLNELAHWYTFGGIPEGFRNTWLFASATALSWYAYHDTLETELVLQAKTWTPGLTEQEVRSSLQSVLKRARQSAEGEQMVWQGGLRDPRYAMRRQTLFEMFEPIIPVELMENGTLRTIISDEYRERNRKESESKRIRTWGELTRDEYLAQNTANAEKPWESLGISRATYYRRKKS